MNRLSTKDRQRVSDALAECARETKSIDNPTELSDAAYNLLSKKLGDNPGLFKAACQVYNSCKSIHKLSEADDKTRGNSFSILDVQELSNRLAEDTAKNIRKAASAPAVFSAVPRRSGETVGSLSKTASSQTKNEKVTKLQLPADFDYKKYLRDAVNEMENLIHKYASALNTAEREAAQAFERFVTAFATEPRYVRKEASARLHANFNVLADELLQRFDEARPLHKIASEEYSTKYCGTPTIPSTGIYKQAMEAMLASEKLKQAEEFYHTAVATIADAAMDLSRKYMAIEKQAAAGTSMAVAATGGASAGAGGSLSKILFGDDATSQEAIKRKIYTTDLSNALMSHGTKRAFMHAVQNPTISKYAVHKIVSAFNKAMAQLPVNARLVPATANQQLIESLMIDALATGAVPSKADTEVIANLANTLGKLPTAQGIYEGNNPDVA